MLPTKFASTGGFVLRGKPRKFARLGAAFVGPLDGSTGNLLGAWSVSRRLLASYTGPLIRVRRSSDNSELDILPNALGSLDTAALVAFVGGNSAYVAKLYDQSGGAVGDMQQSTSSKQPRLVNAGAVEQVSTGRPGARFDGADDSLVGAFLNDSWRTLHVVASYSATTFAGYAGLVGDDTSGGGSHLIIGDSGQTTFYPFDPTPVPGAAYYLNGAANVSRDAPMQTRGVMTLECSAGFGARSKAFLGADRQIAGRYWLGPIAEFVCYSDADATRRAAIETDQLAHFA